MKKTYYEEHFKKVNELETVEEKKKYVQKMDFSPKIEKDEDAIIIKNLKVFQDLAEERVLKDQEKKVKDHIIMPGAGKLISSFAQQVAVDLRLPVRLLSWTVVAIYQSGR